MCGFVGSLDFGGSPTDREILQAMTSALSHRGPDGEGVELSGEVGLGHRRLRIIDLSRAAARALAFEGVGIAEVRVRYAGRAPLVPDDSRERRFLAAQAWSGRPLPPYSLGLSAALLPHN